MLLSKKKERTVIRRSRRPSDRRNPAARSPGVRFGTGVLHPHRNRRLLRIFAETRQRLGCWEATVPEISIRFVVAGDPERSLELAQQFSTDVAAIHGVTTRPAGPSLSETGKRGAGGDGGHRHRSCLPRGGRLDRPRSAQSAATYPATIAPRSKSLTRRQQDGDIRQIHVRGANQRPARHAAARSRGLSARAQVRDAGGERHVPVGAVPRVPALSAARCHRARSVLADPESANFEELKIHLNQPAHQMLPTSSFTAAHSGPMTSSYSTMQGMAALARDGTLCLAASRHNAQDAVTDGLKPTTCSTHAGQPGQAPARGDPRLLSYSGAIGASFRGGDAETALRQPGHVLWHLHHDGFDCSP